MTALMGAAAGGHVNVLKTLIENKADINMLTKVRVLHNCVCTVLYTITIQHVTHFIITQPLISERSGAVYTCTCCLGSSVGRALCLEYRVSWVRVPPEAAHFF